MIPLNNHIQSLLPSADFESISDIHKERSLWLKRDSVIKYRNAAEHMAQFKSDLNDFSGDSVIIGKSDTLSDEDKTELEKSLRSFMPWRKGPFNIFGIDVDAEWRSNLKWNRISDHIPELNGKVIADIGCNNGYYMFRMAHQKPRAVFGFDPSVNFYYLFKGLNSMAQVNNLYFDLLGVEHLHLFKDCFDVIFLMGIIYHHPSPVELLKKVRSALKKDGTLIIETQGIPGDQPVALFPEKRYAKVPGTYFVPSAPCLLNFVKRAGLKNSEVFFVHLMNSHEQRKTDWMTYESFSDFIHSEDCSLTVEGYPAPVRIYLKAINN